LSCSSRTTICPPEPAPTTSTSRPRAIPGAATRPLDHQPDQKARPGDQHQREHEVNDDYGARQAVAERLCHCEDEDQDQARHGDGADDPGEVPKAHVAPPLLVEAEGSEDDHLADRDEGDRLKEQRPVAIGDAMRFVEEAEAEGEQERERAERHVGQYLKGSAPVNRVVQAPHVTGRF